jgi:hypothetical protein
VKDKSQPLLILPLTMSLIVLHWVGRAKSQSDHGAKRAEEILDLMERMVEGGDKSVAPDVHSFSTVINGECRIQFCVCLCEVSILGVGTYLNPCLSLL